MSRADVKKTNLAHEVEQLIHKGVRICSTGYISRKKILSLPFYYILPLFCAAAGHHTHLSPHPPPPPPPPHSGHTVKPHYSSITCLYSKGDHGNCRAGTPTTNLEQEMEIFIRHSQQWGFYSHPPPTPHPHLNDDCFKK